MIRYIDYVISERAAQGDTSVDIFYEDIKHLLNCKCSPMDYEKKLPKLKKHYRKQKFAVSVVNPNMYYSYNTRSGIGLYWDKCFLKRVINANKDLLIVMVLVIITVLSFVYTLL